MNKDNNKLYAIYKNGIHLGNESGISKEEAIRLYIVASNLSELIFDESFLSQYSAEEAINGIHHHYIE